VVCLLPEYLKTEYSKLFVSFLKDLLVWWHLFWDSELFSVVVGEHFRSLCLSH
jgi:hypothetical protein